MYHRIRNALKTEVSGANALRLATEIYNSDRRNNYAAFEETAALAVGMMRDVGLQQVDIFTYPANGVTKQGDWVPPQAWDIESGQLDLVKPDGQTEKLTAYADDPLAVALYSAPTPEKGIEAPVVLWEELARPADAKGKVVFTNLPVSAVFEDAYCRGAVGIVSDAIRRHWDPSRKMEVPDAAYWENAGFVPLNRQKGWAFIITPRQGMLLREKIRNNPKPLRLRARIKSRLYDGVVGIPSGVIPGTDLAQEEVVLLAHMYEIGAADNASGVGASLEAARSIIQLIEDGRLARPRRTIRVLPVYEIYGNIAFYNAHQERARNTIAGVNLDMVGEDMAKTGAFLQMVRGPLSNPSYTDDLMEMLLEEEQKEWPQLRWKPVPFGLMDNVLSDPQIDIPTPSLYYGDDKFYHTSADTPDKLDPKAMKSSSLCGAVYAYFIASAGPAEALWMARRTAERGARRLQERQRGILDKALAGTALPAAADLRDARVFRQKVERQAVISCLKLTAAGERTKLREKIKVIAAEIKVPDERELRSLTGMQGISLKSEKPKVFPAALLRTARKLIPRRIIFGLLTMGDLKLPDHEAARAEFERIFETRSPGYSLPGGWCTALFYANGKRDIAAIAELVKLDSGSCDLKKLIAFFRFAAKHGYLELRKKGVKR